MKKVILSGMTLIELLVSIAIIGILLTVALPIFTTYQRRNTLRLDAKNLEQLFYYSRTLNTNPVYASRNYGANSLDPVSGNEKRYGIKIFLVEKKAILYPIGSDGNIDTTKSIDSFQFNSRENLGLTVGFSNDVISQDLTVFIAGDPPNETVSCQIATPIPGLDLNDRCSKIVNITFNTPQGESKSVSVRGYRPTAGQFKIEIN